MFLLQFRVSKLTHFRAVNFFDKFPKAWSFIKAIRHKQQQTFGCFANSWKLRMACTFSFLVGGECGPDSRSRVLSCQVVPLVSCSKNAESGCNLFQSKFILEATGRFVPVGSGNYIFMCFILK